MQTSHPDRRRINEITVSVPHAEDCQEIYELVNLSGVLDVNSEYLYALLGQHFSHTCAAAKSGNTLVGFASGYILPDRSDVLFIWQIVVKESHQKQGIALALLEDILKRDSTQKVNYIHTTVAPSNSASRALFETLAVKLGTTIIEKPFLLANNFSQTHEEEPLLIIGPIKTKEI